MYEGQWHVSKKGSFFVKTPPFPPSSLYKPPPFLGPTRAHEAKKQLQMGNAYVCMWTRSYFSAVFSVDIQISYLSLVFLDVK